MLQELDQKVRAWLVVRLSRPDTTLNLAPHGQRTGKKRKHPTALLPLPQTKSLYHNRLLAVRFHILSEHQVVPIDPPPPTPRPVKP